jgi:hypothetical protein
MKSRPYLGAIGDSFRPDIS